MTSTLLPLHFVAVLYCNIFFIVGRNSDSATGNLATHHEFCVAFGMMSIVEWCTYGSWNGSMGYFQVVLGYIAGYTGHGGLVLMRRFVLPHG
jgi:hypothetical protein